MIYSIIAIIFESIDSLFKGVKALLESKELTMGAILAGLAPFVWTLNRIRKEKEKRDRAKRVELRQLRIESKIDDLMRDRGIISTWSFQEHGSNQEVQRRLKRLRSLLQVGTILRRKYIMDKLKSRKLWLAIFGALFPVLNVELGINLDPNVVFGVLTVIVSGIAGLAHVDGKKAQAVVKALKTSVVVDPNATYNDLKPLIQKVHDGINDLQKQAKTNDVNILAAYQPILDLIESFKHPEPVSAVEDKVAS